MSALNPNELTGTEKACVLLMTLGASASAEALKQLSDEEIEALAPEMVRLRQVDPLAQEAVLAEFQQIRATASSDSARGSFVTQALELALGSEKAQSLMQNVGPATGGSRSSKRYFQCLWDTAAERIAQLLANEHPQLIAVILTYLPAEKAAAVLSLLEENSQTEVALRISATDEIEPEVIAELEQTVRSALSSSGGDSQGPAGPNVLVDILNNAESSTRTLALGALKDRDPEMAVDVRKKMFLFEDITRLSDRAVQVLLREVDQENLRLALKGATDDIKELVFKNMSERAAESLKEDLELVEQAAPKDVESAQQRVAATVRRLVAAREISIDESVGENVAEATQEAEQPD